MMYQVETYLHTRHGKRERELVNFLEDSQINVILKIKLDSTLQI